jgi:hypothetical protein
MTLRARLPYAAGLEALACGPDGTPEQDARPANAGRAGQREDCP